MYKDPGTYTLKSDKAVKELGATCESMRSVKWSKLMCGSFSDRPMQDTIRDAFERFLELEKAGLE